MKHWGNTRKQCLWAVVITIGLLSTKGSAQEAAPAPKATAATELNEGELSLEEKLQKYKVNIDVSRPLKVTEFIEQLQQSVSDEFGTPLNILVSRNAKSALIPKMRLREVSVYAVLNAAVIAAENEIAWDYSADDEEVIVINLDADYEYQSIETVTVVNVSDILQDTEEASLLSAIEIGLELRDSSKENVTIKLHKETRLLFVKGIEADINIVMKIVAELGGKPWSSKGGGGGFGGGGGGQGAGGGGVF